MGRSLTNITAVIIIKDVVIYRFGYAHLVHRLLSFFFSFDENGKKENRGGSSPRAVCVHNIIYLGKTLWEI